MSWLSSATGIHLNSGRVTTPNLKSLAKVAGVVGGSLLIPGVGGLIAGAGGAIGGAASSAAGAIGGAVSGAAGSIGGA